MNALPVYVINLDRRPDRWRHIENALQYHGFRNIQRISAIDGQKLAKNALERYTTPEARDSFSRPRIRHEELGSLGAVGCFLSHLEVWKRIAQSGNPSLVVEDDAAFSRELPFFQKSNLDPSFDLVLLGYTLLRSDPGADAGPRFGPSLGNGIVPFRSMFFGTHFYYLTPTGALSLLNHALPITMQVDAYMGTEMEKGILRAGVHYPNLAMQRGSDSDIQTLCVGCDRTRNESSFRAKMATVLTILALSSVAAFILVRWRH